MESNNLNGRLPTEIGNLNESKSYPIASIPAKVLKDNYNIISPKLLIDFNSSIRSVTFPQNQKLDDVSPIFKCGQAF